MIRFSDVVARVIPAAFSLLCCGSLAAQTMCGPADRVQAQLAEQFGEVPEAAGMADGGAPVILLVNPSTGSWTILGLSGGSACLITGGSSWHTVTLSKPLPGKPL